MEQQLTATSILSLFQTTKEERESFVNQMVTAMQEGHADPIQVHTQIKCLEHLIEELKENKAYKEMLLDEAAKHGKSFTRYNAQFDVREAGVKYDFSKCGDSEYTGMQVRMKDLKDEMKEREAFLKSVPECGVANPVDGEMIYPATKTSTTTVVVKLL